MAAEGTAWPSLDDLVALALGIQERCVAAGISVSTAESCTGGLIGYALTEVAGSSDYYAGGVVSYSNGVKAGILKVPEAILERHGAVSAQVAVAMAQGVRRALATDLAVSVTGVAGPGGGSDRKPVGLTYVAVADADGHDVRRHVWSGQRRENKLASAHAALTLLLLRLGEGRPSTSG